VIQFHAQPPALLPFHLLLWAQTCLRHSPCTPSRPPPLPLNCTDINFLCSAYRSVVEETGPISHLYYTESDQIVRFLEDGLALLLGASNLSTIVMGHRMQKTPLSSPEAYMEGLILTRDVCGRRGFILTGEDCLIQERASSDRDESPPTSRLPSQTARHRGAVAILKKQQLDALVRMHGAYQA
jgi:hypothetical protein